jgi:hypothetical protein
MRLFSWNVVSKLLGLILLGAAVLKLYGLGMSPVAASGVFSAPEFQIAVVELELFLAACQPNIQSDPTWTAPFFLAALT